MKEKIREIAMQSGADVCGFANIDRFANVAAEHSPRSVYSDCKSLLVLGLALPKGLSQIDPKLIYNYFNAQAVPMVDEMLFRVARRIEHTFGGFAVPLPSDMAGAWDEGSLTAHGLLSMKHLAVQAGVGFMGKNTLLCNENFGNQMTIGTILLSHDLPSDALCKNLCPPGCHKCMDSCPVHAINADGTVCQKLCRENTYKTTFRMYSTVECNKCRMGCPLRFGVKRKGAVG